MAFTTNIRIITPLGELAYRSAEDLGISFNRIADDMQQIDNRFQDFSYDFELPFVKSNSLVFGAPEAKGSRNFFVKNQSISCQVYLNNALLLDGYINLEGLTSTGYKCKFYSKFKELIDSITSSNSDGSEKTLRDLQFDPIIGWQYETSMLAHINADYTCDETFYQYPISHYSTFYCGENIYSGCTENFTLAPASMSISADNKKQNFYYLFNSIVSGNTRFNRMYIHQIPPAIYLTAIIKQILVDAGWKLGGQFFDNKDIKRIIYTYAGDEDIYDQATQKVSGSTAVNLQIAKFLPETSQADFLKDVINLFNLYMVVDINNKTLILETYNKVFGDFTNPYDITSKVDKRTLVIGYEKQNDPTIEFEKANNQNICGDNYVMSGNSDYVDSQVWTKISNKNYYSFFNRKGTTSSIKIEGFSEPNIQRVKIWNDYDISNTYTGEGVRTTYLPCLTKQSPTDNDSKKFNANSGDTHLQNNEGTIKFAGKGSLMFYYGRATTTFDNLTSYMYINVYTSAGTVKNIVPIPVMSPFQLTNNRVEIESWLSGINPNNVNDRRTTTATYLQSVWQLMGNSTSVNQALTTDFSLVFDDSSYFHNTLWTKFHKYKWDRYKNSEIYTATMRMDAVDWQTMQINVAIKYNNELFSIVSIEGYDPIKRTASIKLIKK